MKFFLTLLAILSLLGAESSITSQKLHFKNINKNIMQNIASYAISEKFDGVFGVWDGENMRSKSGKIIAIPRCFADKLNVLNLPKGAFMEGELWIDYAHFEELSSITRRQNPTCADYEKVRYLIFNAPTALYRCNHEAIRGNPHCIYSVESDAVFTMAQNLAQIVPFCDSSNAQICVIRQVRVDSQKALWDFLSAITQKGGEGVIVRDSTTAYKLKAQNDAECKIIDFSRGKGRLSGKVGAIICESLEDKNSGIEGGKIFRIGSGLSDEMRINPPKIGTIITYKFSGVSKNGIPKHTRFLRIYNEN